ncbi:hypothetical protein J6I90_09340 [Pseudidiomarina sp. 1APP75-32.1]|uniref:Secreted protein n=1 Tax=Pseudidiomarina terrestris TaxID=2820060 RepID=A0AAW7R021_9GAMM|nr:hypothetical protein [Pseudidiomarina sp. 1APP75-32.1]MDN7125082.1 hypothetical protein [Pseudidiomarina sp. 1APP75-32.1]
MKKFLYFTLVAVLLVFVSEVYASTAQFCAGFERGYVAGYQQANNTNLTPFVPVCPIQPLKGFGDPESDFEHGYQIGFTRGMNN